MKPRYLITLLLVTVCYLATRWAGLHEFTDVSVQPRSSFPRVVLERVNVVIGSESYPQLAAEGISAGTSVRGYSWLTSLHPAESPDKPLVATSEPNLQWKIVCGPGHGAAVAFGNLIVLIAGDEKGVRLQACQRETGEIAWLRSLSTVVVQPRHPKAAAATSTPVVVNDRVIVCWSDMQQVWIASFDSEGKESWRNCVGTTNAQWGFNSSPVYYRGLVIINVDNQNAGFVSAFDAASGELVWRQSRPDGVEGSYSSPLVIADTTGEAIVVIAGLKELTALDAKNGKVQWTLPAVSDVSAATPVYNNGFLVASSGFSRHHLSALEFNRGIHSEPESMWASTKPSEVPYVPSPVLRDERLYIVQDDGIAMALDIRTGKAFWKKRLGFTVTASPIWIGGTLLACGENGQCVKLNPANGDTLNEFDLHEPILASPTVFGSRLMIRTRSNLHCFDVQSSNEQ